MRREGSSDLASQPLAIQYYLHTCGQHTCCIHQHRNSTSYLYPLPTSHLPLLPPPPPPPPPIRHCSTFARCATILPWWSPPTIPSTPKSSSTSGRTQQTSRTSGMLQSCRHSSKHGYSLFLRPKRGRRIGPCFHCLCMRLIIRIHKGWVQMTSS